MIHAPHRKPNPYLRFRLPRNTNKPESSSGIYRGSIA